VVEERAARNHLASYDEIPHSRIRQATARRLTESQQQVPHFYLRATVRAEALLALREEVNADAPVKVSLNDLLVKAVGAAHQRVPEMNVTWTSDAVRRYRTVDVAVAVATDRGLLTPVVRDVGALTVTALAGSVRELAERARDGKLKQDELEGGSISVTNLGMHGVEEFAAVINPPHAAILAVGAVRSEPVVEDDAVVPGRVISLTLSVDHRPVDGVVAARWLGVLTALLEHPARILA
jgi:pyruvate dehydrogenase E2 component (dihydrolipoamide acetyltransferase)